MRIARPFAWLCLWLVASQAAIDIISERWNYVRETPPPFLKQELLFSNRSK